MRQLTSAVLAAVFLAASMSSGAAQSPCGTREAVLDHLARNYDEAPVAVGVTQGGALIELLTDPSGATWTLIATSPQGQTCLITAGESWKELRAKPEGVACEQCLDSLM